LLNTSKDICLNIYKKMQLIRKFEEKALELGEHGEIPGSLHLYIGQEAISVGVCSNLETVDIITSTHRGHGHLIAKGGEVKYMFSELMGKKNGYNKGKGGSMHIAEPKLGILGANGIVGASLPIGAGAALANKIRDTKQVVVAFFGDGALGTGAVHEAMNMASLWKLPILFVCENNKYAVSLSVKDSCPLKKLSDRAKAYNIEGITIDGMNVENVYNVSKKAIKEIREGKGPIFIECETYRFRDHSIGVERLKLGYRSEEEINKWKVRDPIKLWSNKLLKEGICNKQELDNIGSLIENEIAEAVNFAKSSALPEPEDSLKDMYANEYKNIPNRGSMKLIRK